MYVKSFLIPFMVVLMIIPAALPTFLGSTPYDETERWVSKELERISFPGGAIVVRKIPCGPFSEGYISIDVEAHIASEESLSAYIDSRTKALNTLLDSMLPESAISVNIIFKAPIKPEEFVSLETSLVKLGEYAVVVVDEKTDMKGAGILWFPRPGEPTFPEDLMHVKEGYRLVGIIAAEGILKVKAARILQSDPRVLLIDPARDLDTQKIAEKYRSMGLWVKIHGPAFPEMWSKYVKLKHEVAMVSLIGLEALSPPDESARTLNVNELLNNPSKYDGRLVQVFGKVSDLKPLENPFFKLDQNLLICYFYGHTDLSPQISDVQDGDPIIVTGRFYQNDKTLYAENIRPSKLRTDK